ncbi:MAG: hypothetical protein JEY94_12910 [Melioribacteraceae bacterium]|nr:hypothetical protein [Melioribacteraceae bacterium]
MKNLVNKNYYKWTVKDGDYDLFLTEQEDIDKKNKIKRIRNFSIFSFFISAMVIAVFYFFKRGF